MMMIMIVMMMMMMMGVIYISRTFTGSGNYETVRDDESDDGYNRCY